MLSIFEYTRLQIAMKEVRLPSVAVFVFVFFLIFQPLNNINYERWGELQSS